MLVKDLMTRGVLTVKLDTPVSEVADLLHTHGFNGVPVVDDAGTILGLITERELFSSDSKFYLPGFMKILEETKFVNGSNKELPYAAQQLTKIAAKDIMTTSAYFANEEMPVDGLAEVFMNRAQNPIPVVDHANKLLGIISRSDLIKLLAPATPVHDKAYYESLEKSKAERPIDKELTFVRGDLSSRFAYVAKAKANIWLTAVIVLFIAGFLIGIIYVADPNVFFEKDPKVIITPPPRNDLPLDSLPADNLPINNQN